MKAKLHQLWLRTLALLRAYPREAGAIAALLLVLTGPFLLKPSDSTTPGHWDRKLVILTPHTDRIREEFGHAFAAHWQATTGETLYIDWRVPGGTSEIAMLIKSEFSAAFQQHWQTVMKGRWSSSIAQNFLSAKIEPPKAGEALADEQRARLAFLDSNIGIGIDVFFGGGAYDFEQQAKAGTITAGDGEKLVVAHDVHLA